MTRSTMIHPTAPALRRAYADGPHGQIHYYDSGGPGIPLVLLHQSPTSSSDWFPLMPYFAAAGLRVIAIDTPGMGLSDGLPYEPSMRDFVAAVPAVLDHAKLRMADLLGHHTGAQIAVEVAVTCPQRVRSVALYGVPVMSDAEREDFWQQLVPRERAGAIHQPVPGAAHLSDYFNRIAALFGELPAQRMLLSGLIAGPRWWHGHNAALRHDMRPALLALQQPLLLISHPGEFLHTNTVAAQALRPDAASILLSANAGMAMDTGPEALAAAVIGFLRSARVALHEPVQ